MSIRKDIRVEQTLDVDNIHSREDVRKYVLITYAKEDCNTKTRYFVVTVNKGKRIYIERPTRLNKGCDFVLFAEDVITCENGNDKPPSHTDVLQDISLKKEVLTPYQYTLLIQAIKGIYELKSYTYAEAFVNGLPQIGWTYELLLKLIRWLFIEQDITYWAGDGRNRLYSAIISV